MFSVDPQFERHFSSKLVSFTPRRNVVGDDPALDVDVFIEGYVEELDGNQRLGVVHLGVVNHFQDIVT